jgi:hypothetical protein
MIDCCLHLSHGFLSPARSRFRFCVRSPTMGEDGSSQASPCSALFSFQPAHGSSPEALAPFLSPANFPIIHAPFLTVNRSFSSPCQLPTRQRSISPISPIRPISPIGPKDRVDTATLLPKEHGKCLSTWQQYHSQPARVIMSPIWCMGWWIRTRI